MYQSKIQVFSEIYCLLDYFPETYVYKIPKKLLDLIKQNSDPKYFIKIDVNKSLGNQNILKETKDMLIVLKYNYWSNEEEQKNIRKKLLKNENIYQLELKKKYNSENLFTKKEQEENQEIITDLIQYKEPNIFKKILNKIKDLFKRN